MVSPMKHGLWTAAFVFGATAGVREDGLMIMAQHLAAGIDLMAVLRAAMRQWLARRAGLCRKHLAPEHYPGARRCRLTPDPPLNPIIQGTAMSERFPRPPFEAQQQPVPGSSDAMNPRPDYGEESYRGSGRLRDKAVLLTGGDSGIGRAVALAFAREGADLVVSYLNEHDDAKETASWVEKAGQRVVLVPGDVSTEAHCKELVARTVQEFGRIDVLVNNAAFQASHESIE